MANLKQYNMYINGEWSPPSNGKYFESYNPATEEPWCQVADGQSEDIDRAVNAAYQAFQNPEWAGLTSTQRGHLLRKVGDLLSDNVEELARYETRDNGKLFREMKGQLSYMPQFFYYYAGLADKIHGDTLPIDKQDMFVFTNREPLGVVAAITPWNSPLYLTFLKLAPALIAGNTIVIKPSEYTSASILEFMRIIEKAGFPPGVINVVTGFGLTAGSPLTSHRLVSRTAFTGGVESARKIVRNSAENLSALSLELGGKSPNIIFDDANLHNAVKGVIAGIFGATGQSCVAGSRLFVHQDIYDSFVEKLVARVKEIKVGDPMNEESEMGPVATAAQLETIESYVSLATEEGARLITGGKRLGNSGTGWYYEPTIFEHINTSDRVMQEEIFGPVLSIISFESEEEVIQKANDSNYGLAAGIWTKDLGRAHRLVKKIQAGIVWVNTYRSISPMAPIGGSKLSGYGREGGIEAVYEYTQSKTVWINTSEESMEDPFKIR
ncbi:aldehyde dehydrogenase [Salipaludibacillus sp. CF4.18]|uniref:aldehyde dehydrogenase n=1 Tax=Salipaludibacillus sp. CF4.18 TaxID=3373081 RepID=UPI003EE46145